MPTTPSKRMYPRLIKPGTKKSLKRTERKMEDQAVKGFMQNPAELPGGFYSNKTGKRITPPRDVKEFKQGGMVGRDYCK